jgi:O-antigen/teichoic acid export membrane protein
MTTAAGTAERAAEQRPAAQRRKLAANFVLLTAGEMLAKVAAFLAFTRLGRTLGPERYGAIEFAVAMMIFFSLPVSFGLEEYGARELARRRDDADSGARMMLAAEIGVLRLALALVSALALSGTVAAIDRPMEQKLLLAAFGSSLLLLPGLAQWFFQGYDRMGWVSVLSIVRQSVFAMLVLLFFDAGGPLYRVGLFEAAAVAAAIAAGGVGLRREFRGFRGGWAAMRVANLRRHLAASLPIGLSQITWAFLWYSATLILGFWSTPAAVGDFGVAHRITISLHTFVWLYFFNLLPSISRAAHAGERGAGELRELLESSLRLTAWAGFGVALAVTVAAGPMIAIAFGPAFANAAAVVPALIGMIPLMLISGHYRYALIAADRQSLLMYWSMAGAAVTLVVAMITAPGGGARAAAWSLIAGGVVQFALCYGSTRKHIVDLPMFQPWIGAAASFAVALTVHARLAGSWTAWVIPPAVYGVALWIFEHARIGETVATLLRAREASV